MPMSGDTEDDQEKDRYLIHRLSTTDFTVKQIMKATNRSRSFIYELAILGFFIIEKNFFQQNFSSEEI